MGFRQLLHHYLPAHFHDPLGLAVRLIRTGDAAALFAMAAAAGGAAATPFDIALEPFERQLLVAPRPPRHPLIFVCGAPRSGTTVVYQTLVSHLPVAYFSNLTGLFPRSPLTAQRLLARFVGRTTSTYHSFYGRTQGLAGTNDALYLWDRWLGSDRSRIPTELPDDRGRAMAAFFSACDALFDLPLVNKNNSLNLSAHLVARCLPHARFICMTRNRRQLAQSLYRARCDIHGEPQAPYGAAQPQAAAAACDPVRSVCEQVAFYEKVNHQQRARLGEDRFWVVSYEEFCRAPETLVRRVAREALGDEQLVIGQPPARFEVSTRDRVSGDVAARIDAELATTAAEPTLAACS